MSQHRTLFDNATLRLTLWYMVILMIISVLFSAVLYRVASDEFGRALGPRRPGETRIFIDDESVITMRQQRIDDSNNRVIGNLVFFNVAVLVCGGWLSYVLARRTLRPIEDMMESQVRFSSDAAHELRTPLAVMQAETEVALRDKKATKATHAETLQSNLDEVHRLRTLTDRLLLLAHNNDIELAEVAVDDVATEAMNRVIPLAQAKDIAIDLRIDRATVRANAESLTDILTILLDNAIKYSPAKRTITLRNETKDKFVLIHVCDEGVGIAADDQARIFDRFYRVDTSRSKVTVEGFGLGLSIAKRLIEQQHGTISLRSSAGKGSTFTISLPTA